MHRLKSIHHLAIICTDYSKSKKFYTEILGFEIIKEHYREERNSYKLDLSLNGHYLIELFSFPNPPERPSQPEAAGLRHIAFGVENIEAAINYFNNHRIKTEPVKIDKFTKRNLLFLGSDGLPLNYTSYNALFITINV
jgi:glyoxylase I family protein